jgi:hypothetical protein
MLWVEIYRLELPQNTLAARCMLLPHNDEF